MSDPEENALRSLMLQRQLLSESRQAAPRDDAGNTVVQEVAGGRIVQGSNGEVSFVSPGYSTTDPAIIRRIMDGVAPAEASAMEAPVSTGGRAGIGARGALQGLTFGGGDEIVAAGQSAFSSTPYPVALEQERSRVRQGREESPVVAYGSEIAGAAVPSAMLGYGALNANAGLLGRSLTGAGIGAGEGATYGFLSGEGTMGQRAESAMNGGLIGGAAGGALPSVFSMARAGARRVAEPVGGLLNVGNQGRATNSMLRAFNESGTSVDDLERSLRQAVDDGQPEYVLADALGESGRRTLSGVARQPGPGRTLATEFLDGRQTNQTDRLASFIRQASGTDETAARTSSRLTAARTSEADTLYTAARQGAGPVDVRGALGVIDDRLGPMQGGGVSGDGIDATLARFRSRLAANSPETTQVGGPGSNAVELSDFDRVMGVRQDLQDTIGAAVRAGRNNEARVLGQLNSELDGALEAASDGYRAANDSFRTASRAIDAVDLGAQANRPGARYEDVIEQFNRLSPPEQEAFRAGYANTLLANIERAAPTTNQARPLVSDRQQAVLAAISDDPEALLRRIAREDAMFRSRAVATGGSQTTNNTADAAGVNGEDLGVISNLLSGRPFAAAGQVVGRTLNGATGNNEGTREAVAQMMLSRNPRGLLDALASSQRSESQGRLVGGALRGAARTAGLLGYTGQ